MASDIYINDLRASGMEAKRYCDKKAKWAYGGRPINHGPSKASSGWTDPSGRPGRPLARSATQAIKRNRQHNINQLASGAKFSFRQDVREVLSDEDGLSDSSAEADDGGETTTVAGAGTVMEDNNVLGDDGGGEMPLSFEVSGQTVLVAAVDKAVETFETRETEKLVREYEVVSHDEQEMGLGALPADDDEFEMVDYVHL